MPAYLRKVLVGQQPGGVLCLAAISGASGGSRCVRIFLSATADIDSISPAAGARETDRRTVGGAGVLSWQVPETGSVALQIAGQKYDVQVTAPETELFAGQNVIVALRNGETARMVADWIAYHQKHQNMTAALIVDREGSAKFARNLAARTADMGLERLVVLAPDFPLGRPDLPPEHSPYCAPDAPGKDRMKIPASDPWRSPLGELNLYELLKDQFLAEARAVANIDLTDLITSPDRNIFDAAVNSANGVVRLEGQHCYPWRIRKGAAASFGDHICVKFDASNGPRRWCVAPARLGAGAIWRYVRIGGYEAGPADSAPFMRFMALRHKGGPINKIVPKSSLIEHRPLLELAKKEFAHKPVRMPKIDKPRAAGGNTKSAIVTTMKNEGPFILEWLAYHRTIGFDGFLVYTNDCTDGTDTLLQLLQEKGYVQHRDNPARADGVKPQHAALMAAKDEPIIQDADWIICMDVDEFMNIKVGDGSLAALYDHMGKANMISCTWRLFGNGDLHEFSDQPVIETFERCAAELTRKPHQAWGFKTLFRNIGIFKKLGVHRPKGLRAQLLDQINWVNGSGKPLPRKMFRSAWRSTSATYGYDAVSLNHYAVRSAESFLVKRDRGRVNHVDRDQGLGYWFRMNNNAESETSIQRMLPNLRAEIDRLLADGDIAAAHQACVAAHRDKIKALQATETYADFYATLTSERMQRLSHMHQHFGANVFLAGPDVVPDDVVQGTHAPEYFFNVERQKTAHS